MLSKTNEPFYGITSEEALGRYILDVVPASGLPQVVRTGRAVMGDAVAVKGRHVIVDRYPIKAGGRVIGAVRKVICPRHSPGEHQARSSFRAGQLCLHSRRAFRVGAFRLSRSSLRKRTSSSTRYAGQRETRPRRPHSSTSTGQPSTTGSREGITQIAAFMYAKDSSTSSKAGGL